MNINSVNVNNVNINMLIWFMLVELDCLVHC